MAFPTIESCFICELVRPEAMGKFSVLGYYGISPHVRIQVQDFTRPVQLCFVFGGGSGSGHVRLDLRITAPNGASLSAPHFEGDLVAQAVLTNIFMSFQGVLPGPGDYTATLLVNGAPKFVARFALDPMGVQSVRGLTPPPQVLPH
jgi:hypothetical protein